MINNLERQFPFHINSVGVNKFEAPTIIELLNDYFNKIIEVVNQNNATEQHVIDNELYIDNVKQQTLDFMEWVKDIGLPEETLALLNLWLSNGTLENLINQTILSNINTKVDNFKSEIDSSLAEIETQVDAIDRGIGGTYASLIDIQAAFPTGNDKRYVASDNGNWYYWNGSAWTSGGIFQGIGIDDGVVGVKKIDEDFQYILFPKRSIENPIHNLDETATTHVNASVRFIQKEIIYKNTFLNTIDVYLGNDAGLIGGSLKLELFSIDGNTLTKYYEKTVIGILGVNTIDVNVLIKENSYVCFSRSGFALLKYKTGTDNNCYYTSNITDSTLDTSSLSLGNFVLSMDVEVLNLGIRPFKLETTNSLLVDKLNGDFTNIQDAINSISDDSVDKPYTIMVGQGVFSRFSMRSSVTGISRMRYISIIGINKYTSIIKDDTGHYLTGSCDIWNKGVIENLTVEVTHENDISEPNRKSYALHFDFGQCDTEVRNCILISYQAPAVGIGLYQDTTIKFKNCEMYNLCPSDYPVLLDYGAIFCHSQDATDITNQNIKLENCKVISQYGNKGAWFSKIGTGGEMVVESINTMYFTHNVSGTKVVNNATLSPYNYGNNATNLNA